MAGIMPNFIEFLYMFLVLLITLNIAEAEECGINCKNGCDSNSICNNCITGYYGNKCDEQCPINCYGGCRQGDGYCINGCKPGYRGNTCNTQCEINCNQCQQTDGICTECKPEYWSYKCRKSCRNCNNGCQKSNGNCIGGCKKGYWGLKCYNNCNKCNQGCQPDTGFCNSGRCISGYYSDKCDIPCPTNCNGECSQNNGDCEECNDGYWGNKCQAQCPTNCRQVKCDKNNGYCSECKNYYWGGKCEKKCSANCVYHQYNTTCYKTNGTCYSGCKDTWYGDTCNNKCSSTCKQRTCFQSQSRPVTCTTGCIDGYKGSYCQDTCLNNCIICNRYNNLCTSCKTGWYGNQCQTKCNSNCINGCDQDTGECLDGSVDRKTDQQCTETSGSSDGISPLVAGIIGAMTSMVLLPIIILVYRCLIKRKKRCNTIERTVKYTSSDNVDITEPSYENVQHVTSSQVEAGSYEALDRPLPSPTYETMK